MGRLFAVLFLASSIPLSAQSASPVTPPQSARQALLEMFFGKGENDFQKHLPDDARQVLIHKGETPETSTILRISTIGRELAKPGDRLETFETGPAILSSQMSEHEKVEINVERDSLIGETDEIELSVHYYKDGLEQSMPVVPQLIFTFKQEKEIWKLIEVTAAAHAPLTNPDYLKGLRKQQDEETESQAQNRINAIAFAESTYAGKHPDRGFSCSLPGLFAPDPAADPNEGGGVADPGMGSDEFYGYKFTLDGCAGTPATKYKITATPADPDSTLKAFCSDESGTTKSIAASKAQNCSRRGTPVNAPNQGME